MSGSFLDSNIVLYLLSNEERKALVVEGLLKARPTISAQVLNEISNVLRRKRKLDWPEIDGFVEDLLPLTSVLPITTDTNRAARAIAARYGFSFYDAVIVASAIEGQCTQLFTEDIQHGQRIGTLTVLNPFR